MSQSLETLRTDILIIGSGGAGLMAALHALQADPDLDVTIAVKGLIGKCGCTRMVQGGWAAVKLYALLNRRPQRRRRR